VGATEEQRTYWLRRIADEGLIVAYAVTEPLAGQRAVGHSHARRARDGERRNQGLQDQRAKQFISNGGYAQLYHRAGHRAPMVPLSSPWSRELPGLVPGKHENKLGIPIVQHLAGNL